MREIKTINYKDILTYLKSVKTYRFADGPVSVNNFNDVERKVYFATHNTDPNGIGDFLITYESESVIETKAFRFLEFNFINYECSLSEENVFFQDSTDTLPIEVFLQLNGDGDEMGTNSALGLIAAVTQINKKKILSYFIYLIFHNVQDSISYLPSILNLIGTKENVFLFCGLSSEFRLQIGPIISQTEVLLIYPGYSIDSNSYSNLISVGITMNHLTLNTIHTVLYYTSNVIIMNTALEELKGNRPYEENYLIPGLENAGINIIQRLRFDKNEDYSFINDIMPEGVIISILEDENLLFLMNIYEILKPPKIRVYISIPTSSIYQMNEKYTNGHIVSSSFIPELYGEGIPSTLEQFYLLIKDDFNIDNVVWETYVSYSSLNLFFSALLVANAPKVSDVLKSLFDVKFDSPTGLVEIGDGGLINRRMITAEFIGKKLKIIRYPETLYLGGLSSYLKQLDTLSIGSIAQEERNMKTGYILYIHEYTEANLLLESNIAALTDIVLGSFNKDVKLHGYLTYIKHLFIKSNEIAYSKISGYNPVLVIGCYLQECTDLVIDIYTRNGILFMSSSQDYERICNYNTFFIQPNLKEKFKNEIQYMKDLQIKYIVIIYSSVD